MVESIKGLKVIFSNVRSIRNKFDEFHALLPSLGLMIAIPMQRLPFLVI